MVKPTDQTRNVADQIMPSWWKPAAGLEEEAAHVKVAVDPNAVAEPEPEPEPAPAPVKKKAPAKKKAAAKPKPAPELEPKPLIEVPAGVDDIPQDIDPPADDDNDFQIPLD